MKTINVIATILVVVGGLNWGLHVFDMNLVNLILGSVPMLESAVYLLVALSAVVVFINMFKEE